MGNDNMHINMHAETHTHLVAITTSSPWAQMRAHLSLSPLFSEIIRSPRLVMVWNAFSGVRFTYPIFAKPITEFHL